MANDVNTRMNQTNQNSNSINMAPDVSKHRDMDQNNSTVEQLNLSNLEIESKIKMKPQFFASPTAQDNLIKRKLIKDFEKDVSYLLFPSEEEETNQVNQGQ